LPKQFLTSFSILLNPSLPIISLQKKSISSETL
jgi:hypothetical protein